MNATVEMPLWLFVLILLFAAIAFASHFLFPSVRWFFRRRLERAVRKLNARLERPIEPFKLIRRFDMIQRLSYDTEVLQAVVAHARETGVPESVAAETARRYAREIVPSFSASIYFGIAIRLARALGEALYRVRVVRMDEAGLAEIPPDATVVFVMNHRSNMDYVLVTYLAADRLALSYAVGEWAQVWPLSRLIRAMGAYFIRRRSRDDLYRRVLARYVALATEGGVTQAMFPEGGLSQSGALRPAKLGLLKYITDAHERSGRDVVFVPVALNYDRVLEDRILIAAAGDPSHRYRARMGVVARSVLGLLWRRLTGRYHRFGYAGVSFGSPLSLERFLEAPQRDPTVALARELMRRIGSITPVLSVPLVATLFLDRPRLSRAEVERGLSGLLGRIPGEVVHLPRNNRDYAAEVGLRSLVERGVLREADGAFQADPGETALLRFYANSIAHLLRPGDAAPAKAVSASAGS